MTARMIFGGVILLASVGGASALGLPPLNMILGGAGPAEGRVVAAPVAYQVEPGPGWRNPMLPPLPPPNLTDADLKAAGEGLRALGGRAGCRQPHFDRLSERLSQIDRDFIDNIDDWPAKFAAMRAGGEKKAAEAGAGCDVIIDEMLKIVSERLDPYSEFLTPEELESYRAGLAGSYQGIGTIFFHMPGTHVRIHHVFPGSPAEAAGLRRGDVVTHVAEPDGPFIPTMDKPLREITQRTRGVGGTKVLLKIVRGGTPLPAPVEVTRGPVPERQVFAKMLTGDIGYIHFNRFGAKGLDHAIFREIDRLEDEQGMMKLVLDLRGNPGGNLEFAASIAAEFLRDSQSVAIFKRNGQVVLDYYQEGPGRFADLPLVVLVNGGSASASEIVAAALQDHKRALIVGSRTFGKATMQTLTADGSGAGLKITRRRWYTPNDRSVDADYDRTTGARIEGTGGVVPDREIEVDPAVESTLMEQLWLDLVGAPIDGERAPDPALEEAIRILAGSG